MPEILGVLGVSIIPRYKTGWGGEGARLPYMGVFRIGGLGTARIGLVFQGRFIMGGGRVAGIGGRTRLPGRKGGSCSPRSTGCRWRLAARRRSGGRAGAGGVAEELGAGGRVALGARVAVAGSRGASPGRGRGRRGGETGGVSPMGGMEGARAGT